MSQSRFQVLLAPGRHYWAYPSRPWRVVRYLFAIVFCGAGLIWIFYFVTHVHRLGWPGLVVTLLFTIFYLRCLWAGQLWRRDAPIREQLEQIGDQAGDQTAIDATVELLPRIESVGLRLTASIGPLAFYVRRSDWQRWEEIVEVLPWEYRRMLRSSESALGSKGLSMITRFEILRSWLRGLFVPQGTRALIVLSLAQVFLHHQQDYLRSFEVGRRIWRVRRGPNIAWNCACSLARAGRTEDAVDWLLRAVRVGSPATEILREPDLASLLSDRRIAALTVAAEIEFLQQPLQ